MEIKNIYSKTTLNNGVEMPVLGLGVYKTRDGAEVENAINYALNAGYRLIDTASFYANEEGVGKACRSSIFPREDLFVTSKLWLDDQGYKKTHIAFERALDRLKLDYLDLYMIHWPMPDLYIESWKAMEELYNAGKIRAIGVCNCLPHHIESIKEKCEIKPMVLQNEFHPRLVQPDILRYCSENDIQLQAWAPLMRGQILDNNVVATIAQKHHKTAAQVLVRWDLQKGVCTIPKSVHEHRIVENADVFDFELSIDEIQQIDALDREERTGAHPDNFLEHFEKKGVFTKS